MRTNTDEARVLAILDGLRGHVCTGVDNPIGSVLRLDIGPLSVPTHGSEKDGTDRGITPAPHGWRHLTIESPWRILYRGEVVCDWNDRGGFHGTIGADIRKLLNARVEEVQADTRTWDLAITFNDDLELGVFCDTEEDREEALTLMGTDNLLITAGAHRWLKGGAKIKRPVEPRTS